MVPFRPFSKYTKQNLIWVKIDLLFLTLILSNVHFLHCDMQIIFLTIHPQKLSTIVNLLALIRLGYTSGKSQ